MSKIVSKVESKLVLITGASSGFGRAIAIKLSKAGYDLILLARRKQKLLELAEQLSGEANCKVHCLVADVNQRQELALKLAELPSDFQDLSLIHI